MLDLIRMMAAQAGLRAQCSDVEEVIQGAEALPLHVTEWGTTGPAVVMVHGGVQGGTPGGEVTFGAQRALGEKGFRLRVVDRPGFGRSPRRGVDDQMVDGRWIAEMLDDDGAHLLGHSWGGVGTLLAAAERPELVRSLVLVEPALHALLVEEPELESRAEVKEDAAQLPGLVLKVKTPAEYARLFLEVVGRDTVSGQNEITELLSADETRIGALGCSLLTAKMAPAKELRRAVETVTAAKVPLLLVSGGWSPSFDAVGEMLARMTGGEHVRLRSPNHFVQTECAAEVNGALERFWRESEARRG